MNPLPNYAYELTPCAAGWRAVIWRNAEIVFTLRDTTYAAADAHALLWMRNDAQQRETPGWRDNRTAIYTKPEFQR